jgi:2Fe-2S ferredoxin|tara:strand:+ start:273 stop:572 length:300 start_codon:yes stop_codon:yes gene_type:complete
MAKIHFKPDNITHEVPDGEALIKSCDGFDDISLTFGCTEGSCGVCELTIVEGQENCSKPNEFETEYLYPEDIEEGMRLGCQVRVLKDEVALTWKGNRAK